MLPRRKLNGQVLALIGVLVFAAWFSSPIWRSPDRVFAGLLSTDNIVTPWFYDHVARQLAAGNSMERMTDFDWPAPLSRMREFPGLADATLAAPLSLWLDWPAQWGATLTLAVVLNGLGMACLASAAGLGGWGVLTVGMMGVMMRPIWTDMAMGRMNVAFVGMVSLSMAFVLWSLPERSPSGRRPLWRRLSAAVVAAGVGGVGALIYPPFVLMLAPMGLLLALSPVWRGGWLSPLLPVLALGGGMWLVSDSLLAIYQSQDHSSGCSSIGCPDIYNAVALADLMRWEVEPRQGLSHAGLVGPGWLLVPLALLHSRRKMAVALMGLAVLMACMALGPCPRLTVTEDFPREWVTQMWPFVGGLWCASAPLHDYGRFATVSAVLLAMLSGMGIDALTQRGRLRSMLGVGMAGWVLWQMGQLVMGEILDPRKWHQPQPPASALFLQEVDPGPVVELPFDRSQQFLSVLYAPGSPRVNPIRPNPHPLLTREPVIVWLFSLGWGEQPEQTVTTEQVQASGLRWVLYDTDRCVSQGQKDPCPPLVRQTLGEVLGTPAVHGNLLVWDVQDLSLPP